MQPLRICFAGTPAFSAAHLSAILGTHHHVVAVYTQPDRPAGRGKKLQASPVKELALQNSIPVYQPSSLKSKQEEALLAELQADVLVVVAYGLILPKAILTIPTFGCINVHASLLPRWRGAAPIERALLAGDKETGITIMQMDEGLDTGDMLLKETVSIEDSDTRDVLEQKLIDAGTKAIVYTLDNLQQLSASATTQQDADSTYAAKLAKSEALISWEAVAQQTDRQVRAGIGRTPAYTFLNGQRLRIIETQPAPMNQYVPPGTIISVSKDSFCVACTDSSLIVKSVQLPGKKPLTVRDLLNSRPDIFQTGMRFSALESPIE